MKTSNITRRNFIKRTATTAVAAAFAVTAFNSYSLTRANGSCYCVSAVLNAGQTATINENTGAITWPAGSQPIEITCDDNYSEGSHHNINVGDGPMNITSNGQGITVNAGTVRIIRC